jgi:Protein of unknown function (DUF4199)
MKNPGLKYGLLGGAAVVVYFLLIYFSNKQNFLNPVLQWASMLIYITFMYVAAKEDCAEHGTDRDFRAVLRTPFVAFVLINLFYWLFSYSLHLADPEMLKMETAAQIQYLKDQIASGLGDPTQTSKYREQIQYLEQQGMVMPVGPVFVRMALGAIGGFGLAAGLAAILRR